MIYHFWKLSLSCWKPTSQKNGGIIQFRIPHNPTYIRLGHFSLSKCIYVEPNVHLLLLIVVAPARIELARPLLVKGFSYHTCFYTSQLKDILVYSTASHFELFRLFCSSLSCCGLDYFITILVNSEVRN